MKSLSRRVGLFGLCALVIAAAVAGQPDRAAANRYPPQFPREGATKLFENEHVIVWEQVGRPKEPFVHKHIRDILTFGVEDGRIVVQQPAGRDGKEDAAATTRIYARGANSLSYSKAGLGPHIELAPDPDRIPRSIFVELKGTEPKDCRAWSTACP